MRYHSLKWLFLSCFLGLMVGFDLLPYFSKSIEALALEPIEIKSPKFLPDSQNKCLVESKVDSVYAQAQPISNEDVASLAKRLDKLDKIRDQSVSGDREYAIRREVREVVRTLADIRSVDSLTILAKSFSVTRPYTYESIISLGYSDPALVFLIAKKASQQSTTKTSPVAIFLPAITGDFFKSMSPDIQARLGRSDRREGMRLNSVAALANADYDATDELISLVSTPELFSALIEVITQGETLWCGSGEKKKIQSNKIVSFANSILKRIGSQFIPTLTAVANKEIELSKSLPRTASYSLTVLQSALNDTNLNRSCPGCCGTWSQIFAGVLKILKP